MTRSVDDEVDATAAQTFEPIMIDPAEKVEELIEAFVSGNGVNVPDPEKFACGYAERPGCSATFNGSEIVEPLANPGEGDNLVEDEVNRLCRSCGFVFAS